MIVCFTFMVEKEREKMQAKINHYAQWYQLDPTFDIDLDTIQDKENTVARVSFNILPTKEFYKVLIQKLEKSFLDKIVFESNGIILTMNNVWVDIKKPRGMIDFISLEFESAIEDVKEERNPCAEIEIQETI